MLASSGALSSGAGVESFPLALAGFPPSRWRLDAVGGRIGRRHAHPSSATIGLALLAGLGFAVIFIALDKTTSASGIWPLVSARVVSITLIAVMVGASGVTLRGHGTIWRLAAFTGLLDMTANLPVVGPTRVLSPVLLVRGEYDGIATIADLEEFYNQLPNGDRQFIILPGTAHSVALATNRQLFWHVTKAFLEMPTPIAT